MARGFVIAGVLLTLLQGLGAQVRDQRSAPPRGTATVAGRVEIVTSKDRAPLRRARLTLAGQSNQHVWTAASDGGGNYVFEDLPAGRYTLNVDKPGFVRLSAPADLQLPDGGRLVSSLEVQPAGALEGRFLDGRGVPVERVDVRADRLLSGNDPGTSATYAGRTDDLGRFRIHTIPPGRYRLYATASTLTAGEKLYYPGTASESDAAILVVEPGRTVDRLDVSFPAAEMSTTAESVAAIEREIAGTPDAPGFAGRLTGRVTSSDLGVPISGAVIDLFTSTGVAVRTVSADGDGAFSFNRLPDGTFIVRAAAPGYLVSDPIPLRAGVRGKPVTIAAGSRIVRAELSLTSSRAIEVRVIDEFGEPAPGIAVQISQAATPNAMVRLLPDSMGRGPGFTDDRGMFRASGLVAGDYYVVALPEPFARSGPAPFAPTYFPGTTSPDAAAVVHLTAGADAHDVSFRLVATTTATISGVVVDAESQRKPNILVVLIPMYRGQVSTTATTRTAAEADGRFVFRNVPEGEYLIQGLAAGEFGSLQLTLAGGSDRRAMAITLRVNKLATVRGRVTFEGGPAPPTSPGMYIAVRPVDLESTPIAIEPLGRMAQAVAPGWTFEIRSLPGRGKFLVMPPPGTWRLARIMLHGRDVTDVTRDFHTGDINDLEVIMTNRVGTLTGTVLDAGRAAADIDVFIVSAEEVARGSVERTLQQMRTDERGAFSVASLVAGQYLALAVRPQTTPPRAADLLNMMALATPITVTEAATATVTLRIVR